MPSVVHASSSDFPAFSPCRETPQLALPRYPPRHDVPHFPLVRYPLGKRRRTGSTRGENPCATVFSSVFSTPFSTVFRRASVEIRSVNQGSDRFPTCAAVRNGENGKNGSSAGNPLWLPRQHRPWRGEHEPGDSRGRDVLKGMAVAGAIGLPPALARHRPTIGRALRASTSARSSCGATTAGRMLMARIYSRRDPAPSRRARSARRGVEPQGPLRRRPMDRGWRRATVVVASTSNDRPRRLSAPAVQIEHGREGPGPFGW